MKYSNLSRILASILLLALFSGCNLFSPAQNPVSSNQTFTSNSNKVSQLPTGSKANSTQTVSTTSTTQTSIQPVPSVVSSKAFPGTLVLGGPTSDSIDLNLLAASDLDFYIEYGKSKSNYTWHTSIQNLTKD
jgi:hypothetical protein